MENISYVILITSIVVVFGLVLTLLVRVLVVNKYRKSALALVPGGEKRLEILKNGTWTNTQVLLDGALVATIPDRRSLINAQYIPLPDSSILKIQLIQRLGSYYGLKLWRDGEPLPGFGLEADLEQKVMNANAMLMVVAIFYFSLAFGILFYLVLDRQPIARGLLLVVNG